MVLELYSSTSTVLEYSITGVEWYKKHLTNSKNQNGLSIIHFNVRSIVNRGGVEDTRLEAKAKAKDTKKIRGQGQGQGQPFRGQNLSRPRTGMLEAKAKDRGHRRKCSQKKSLQKFFSGDLQFIGVPRIFDWGKPKPQIT